MKLNQTITEKKEFEVRLFAVNDDKTETEITDKNKIEGIVDNYWDSEDGIPEVDVEEYFMLGNDDDEHLYHIVIKKLPIKNWLWSAITDKNAEYDLEEK